MAVVFFGTQVRCMMSLKPNYGPHRKIPSAPQGFKFSTWILKGYYPGTTTLFRISLVHDVSKSLSETTYYAKVIMPPIALRKKQHKSNRYSSDEIDKYVTGSTEHAIFGTEKPPIVNVGKLNIPKCISPRGMPVFKLAKKDRG